MTDAAQYVSTAREYARSVLAGETLACQWVQRACERQTRDLERAAAHDPAFPYYFDERAAAKPCAVVEGFRHVKGEWARHRERIRLEPFQVFALTTVFGWRRRANRARRFRVAYNEMARKNAKSTLASGVGLYLMACDGEPGALVVSAATTRDQAKLCFTDAQILAKREAGFRRVYGVEVRAQAITQERTGSAFKALSAEGDHQDGLNIHGAVIDELHAHKTRAIWDVIDSATGARQQSLMWVITTAGANQHGICYEVRTYVTRILDGLVEDDSVFGIIYTLDEGDDWQDARLWGKANPNLGVSVYREDLERMARKAAAMPAAQVNFLTKRLNLWVNASSAWLDARVWRACAAPLALDELRYQTCYIGIDLATKNDLVALAIWFPATDERKHRVFFRLFVPEAALAHEENARLAEFARLGAIAVHAGPVADYEALADTLEELGARFDVREIAGDPWQLPPLYSVLKRRSSEVPIVEVRQIVANMSPAMKETTSLLLEQALEHDANPAVAWMISNVVCSLDSKENWYPRKEHRANKIDGPIALFLAADRVLRAYGTLSGYDVTPEIKSVPTMLTPAARAPGDFYTDPLRGL
jgi:phage terminase large subunit-like protein